MKNLTSLLAGLKSLISDDKPTAAVLGNRVTRFIDVYEDEAQKWCFSWYSIDHKQGSTDGGFLSRADAEFVMNQWIGQHPSVMIVRV